MRDKKIDRLLRDHGFRVEGRAVIEIGIRGFSSDRVLRYCRNHFDALEQLFPLLANDKDFCKRASAMLG